MENQSKFLSTKKIAITALLMTFGFGLFATGPEGKNATKERKKERVSVAEVIKTLSADEAILYKSVDEFYQKNYVQVADHVAANEQVAKVIVYDLAGNVLQEQDGKKGEIDLSKLPAHAKLLMTENGTQFYLVM
ncbi:MAG: hypothetical protein ACPGJS_00385 [Flammeovirgaceae bacterium]